LGIWNGDLRDGKPLTASARSELVPVSNRPIGDVLDGSPDVALLDALAPVSFGTAKLAFDMTGDVSGVSFGKRAAAADGECIGSVSSAGFRLELMLAGLEPTG